MRRRHMLGNHRLTICGYPTTKQERRVMRKTHWEQISCKHCLAMHDSHPALGLEVPA